MTKSPTKKTVVAAPTVTSDTTQEMATYRHYNLEYEFKELKREDFNDDEAYRAALLKQYEALRQQEYKYIVRNEALKAYNCSCDGKNAGINPNRAWGGYHEYPQFLKQHTEHRDSAQVQHFPELCTNHQYMNMHKNIKKDGTVKSIGAYTCAVTATALQMQISDKMGYEGNNNIITRKTNYASATNAATCVSKEYQISGNGKKTLNQMILSGEISVGDEVSTYPKKTISDNTVVTASGKHCITIADISRNEKGEIVSFTYQANNIEAFQEVNINDNSGQGGRLVWNATKTHVWSKDKIKEECANLNQKTNEEISAEITKARQRTNDLVDDLQKTEQYAATHQKRHTNRRTNQNYLADARTSYQRELTSRRDAYNDARDKEMVSRVERENAQKEAELKQRELEIIQKEQQYAKEKAEFLEFHPEKEEVLAQKSKEQAERTLTPQEPQAVTITPQTESSDYNERARNAMERKQQLEQKEQELDDRQANLDGRATDLIMEKINTPQTKEEKKARKKAEKEEKEEEKDRSLEESQKTSAAEPTVHAVEVVSKVQQEAEFKEVYTNGHIDQKNSIKEASKENQRIAQQTQKTTSQQTSSQQEPTVSQKPVKTISVNALLAAQQRKNQTR